MEQINERANRLIDVAFEERRKHFPKEIMRIENLCVSRGTLGSSMYFGQLCEAYESEGGVRAILVWQNLVRAHQSFGAPSDDTLPETLKGQFNRYLQETIKELSGKLTQRLQNHPHGIDTSLGNVQRQLAKKHDVEIDIYADSLRSRANSKQDTSVSQHYNFYGAIGAVQTGASASANVLQNLGAQGKEAIISALGAIRKELHAPVEIADSQKEEIVEIIETSDCPPAASSADHRAAWWQYPPLGRAHWRSASQFLMLFGKGLIILYEMPVLAYTENTFCIFLFFSKTSSYYLTDCGSVLI